MLSLDTKAPVYHHLAEEEHTQIYKLPHQQVYQIPGANKMCQQLTNSSKKKELQSNGSTSYLDCDILAVHAYEQGLVHESDNRYKLSLAIQNHHETLGTDLPPNMPRQGYA